MSTQSLIYDSGRRAACRNDIGSNGLAEEWRASDGGLDGAGGNEEESGWWVVEAMDDIWRRSQQPTEVEEERNYEMANGTILLCRFVRSG